MFGYTFWGALYVAIPLLVLLLLHRFDQEIPLPDALWAVDPEVVVSHRERPPVTGWSPVSQRHAPPSGQRPFLSFWYRVPLPSSREALGLYIPYPAANLDVWVNEHRLALTGPMTRPLPYLQNPYLLPLPPVDTDDAYVYVRVARYVDNLSVPATAVGPLQQLLPAWERLTTIWVRVPLALLLVMGVILLFVAVLYVLNPRESAYAWYLATMTIWMLHTGHAQIEHIFLPHTLWFSLTYLFITWAVTELVFINRFFDLPMPATERWVVAVTAVLCLMLLGIAATGSFDAMSVFGRTVFTGWCFSVSVLITVRYLVAVLRRWSFESLTLWLTSGVVGVVAVRDILFQTFGAERIGGTTYYLQYVALLPLGLFGIHLVRRFSRALRTASLRNDELDRLVDERTRALATSYETLSEEVRRRTVAEERTRLMRDMHDGLGGQLVQALALSEQGSDRELERSLRLALDDLRLIVDSLSPDNAHLSDLLASFRHRSSKALARAGFDVSWVIDDSVLNLDVSPQRALNLLRILQEAVTNAIRHSHGQLISIGFYAEGAQLRMSVRDNGCGIHATSFGRGLDNMRVRAREIGGSLAIVPAVRGTHIEVRLPG
ncbi:MAG: ATP-binding protein [Pseudomonadota bacterium]